MAQLEHLNITVTDPDKTARMLCNLFDWNIRWSGDSTGGGYTVHVGTPNSYLALYKPADTPSNATNHYSLIGGANHVGIVVEDLSAAERRVLDAGFRPHTHGNYEPGRRFYFHDSDNIEFEIISYQ